MRKGYFTVKKVCAVCLAVTLFVCLLSVFGCGQKEGFSYEVNEADDGYEVLYKGNATILTIPEEYNGYSVNEIADGAFTEAPKLETLKIHNGIRKIHSGAFGTATQARSCAVSVIVYDGTVSEWNNIIKEEGWDMNFNVCNIVCTDGEVFIDNSYLPLETSDTASLE